VISVAFSGVDKGVAVVGSGRWDPMGRVVTADGVRNNEERLQIRC
jgi:hypothetical protein